MIRHIVNRPFTDGKIYVRAAGLSTDAKPAAGLATGSRFLEVDTGKVYFFDEAAGSWDEDPQLTAAISAYLEDHPEAIDQAAIEAMFGDQLDGIEEDVGGLKSAVADLEAGSLSALGATAGQVPTADGEGSWAWADPVITHTVTGANPVIVAQAGHRYICGEVATISITPPASGICDVVFASGTTAAILTVPNTVKWPEWFDPTSLAASTTYELSIMDGLGVVSVWA